MTKTVTMSSKPEIIIGERDHERLSALAAGAAEQFAEVAEELYAEMKRARVLASDEVPPNVVRMGSTVTFQRDAAAPRRVTLVFPGEADIAKGRISILTPIGTALIGLSPGQSITFTTPDGRHQQLTVLDVEPAQDEESLVVDLASRRAPDVPAAVVGLEDDEAGRPA